jgi:general secretion pathway protein K
MRPSRRGAAIVSALLILALIATLITAAYWRLWRSVESESASRQQAQARWLLTGAADWALALLEDDGRFAPGVDHLREPWAQPVQDWPLDRFLGPSQTTGEAPADEARLSVVIGDAQAKLNLLNLLEGTGVSAPWLEAFSRLFAVLALPTSELEQLSQSLVRASAGTGEGAQRPGPLMPERADDLHWLGLAPATMAALRPHVIVLPGRLAVNLNTAGPTVLQAVLDLPEASVQALIARRQSQPLTDLGQVGLGLALEPERHTVNSYFFEAQLTVRLGTTFTLSQRLLVQRQGGTARILWRY